MRSSTDAGARCATYGLCMTGRRPPETADAPPARRSWIARLAGVAIVVILAAAGCGGDDQAAEPESGAPPATTDQEGQASAGEQGSGGSASGVDPCSLLPPDDVAEQLEATESQATEGGYEVSPEDVSVGGDTTCKVTWQSEASNAGMPVSQGEFRVDVQTAVGLEILSGADSDPEPIPGVGDEAFFVNEVPYARVGDVAVGIVNLQSREAAVELLRVAAGRLR